MKLNRLNSIANQVIRDSIRSSQKYMIDPFYHYTPDFEILVDLKLGIYTPEVEEDDVKKYYDLIIRWFHEILPKEGIPLNIIDKAILKISAQGKECIIEAQGRRFKSFEKF